MTETFRVGVTPDFQTQAAGLLEPALAEALPGVAWEFLPDTGDSATREALDRYDAVIALGLKFPATALNGTRRLAVIARWGVGYDRIDVPACTANDVMLAITPEGVRRPVAEGIIALAFALAKNLRHLDRICRTGAWRQNIPRNSGNLEGKTLGSVGAGNIAGEMFRIARGIGLGRLLAYDPYVAEAPEAVEMVDLETVMRESDFVAVNCPLSEPTRKLVGAREIGWMKPTAYLINTARGPIVDEAALIEALQQGRIAGAGLDVFENEPVESGNPLLRMDNVIVTPHAVAWTQESFRGNSLYACRNVAAVARGEAPKHVVNREVLERPGCRERLAKWRKTS